MGNTNNIKLSGGRRLGWAASTFASLLLLFAQRVASQTTYTITDIGTLGGTFSVAVGVNESGWINGFSTLPGDTAIHAFVWRRGRLTDLGTLGGPNSATFFPLNDSGEITGVSDTSTPNPLGEGCFGSGFNTNLICRSFFWRGVMTPLPTLGGYNSAATEVNNRGQVAGFAENTVPDPTCVAPQVQVLQVKPVTWEKGEVRELPTLPGDPNAQALAINDYGQVVGHSGDCGFDQPSDTRHAWLWQGDTVTDLGNLGGAFFNVAVDINNQGQVVGHSDLPGDTTGHAFLWQNGVMSDLGTLPGDFGSGADSINSKSQVTGLSFDASGNGRAFLWQNGVMTDFNTLIPSSSPLYLVEANNINDHGMIVGLAVQISTGEVHAFLATPNTGGASSEGATPGLQSQSPRGVVPERVRELLRKYGRGPMKFLTSGR